HAEAVVLAEKEDGQVPGGGQVGGLVELADVARTLAEDDAGDGARLLDLGGPGQPGGQGEVAADDGVPAPHAALRVGEVHRAAAPAGHAGGLAEELGHAAPGVHAAHQGPAVVAVVGEQV